MGKTTKKVKRKTQKSKIDYKVYVREYKKEAAKHEMYAPMFKAAQYRAAYVGSANSLKAEGKAPYNITRNIVQRQAFKQSRKQTASIVKSFKENKSLVKELADKAGISINVDKLTIKSLRYNKEEESNKVGKILREIRGYYDYDDKEIRVNFFGSE